MTIIATIIIGITASFVASVVLDGHTFGVWEDFITGISGASVGGLLLAPVVCIDTDSFCNAVLIAACMAMIFLVLSKVVQVFFHNLNANR